jgi:hypothetical protein
LPSDLELPAALGWLYVAEGSNLGGTILYKMAAKLGLIVISALATWPRIRMARRATGASSPLRWTRYR